MSMQSLQELITVRGRFHRSVNLVHDGRGGVDLSEYIVTPSARELAEQVLGELDRPVGTRAWSITGPYGSGKSALGLFLVDILASPAASHAESRRLREGHAAQRPFLPVLAVAEKQPIENTIASAFADALDSVSPKLARRFRRFAKGSSTSDQLISAILEAASLAQGQGLGGVLFLLDEMGKFLEYAAEGDLDLFFLQQLAEAAARSDAPLVFISILHTGFADYLPVGDDLRRQEWQKVQGRFRDVPFHLPAEQLLGLVAHSLEKRWAPEIEEQWRGAVDRMIQTGGVFEEAARRLDLRELFYACYPFHPITALLLWPVFRSKLAQNERSLFAFLTSSEPFGFREFLRRTPLTDAPRALYRPFDLYDYITHALGMAAFRGEQARRWALVEHALARLPADAPPVAAEMVKTVGLLGMYGSTVGLHASPATLRFLGGSNAEEAINYLQDQSILVFRRHTGAYALWEGSDIDLEAAYAEALHQSGNAAVAARVRWVLDLRPVVARAHYIESGTLRVFGVDVVEATSRRLAEALAKPFEEDGRILYVLGGDPKQRAGLIEEAKAATADGRHPLTILVVPQSPHSLDEALGELEAWRWVNDHMPELAGDPVARQEVRARMAAARERFERMAGGIFGLPGRAFEPELSTWIHDGEEWERLNAVSLQRRLSSLCEQRYNLAPLLRNELINRQSVSSATSAARRTLLEQVLAFEAKERLGIEGNPPEASIYASMLQASGIHALRDGDWSIGRPTHRDWQPAWDAVVRFIDEAEQSRQPLRKIYEILSRPPFGMREGPVSLLVSLVLTARRDEIAIYEDDIFVAEFRIEVLERLLRRPETFAIQSLRLSSEQLSALRQLRRLVIADAEELRSGSGREALIPVVRSLVLSAAQLPPYAKRTSHGLTVQAAAVRDALIRARDPRELLFDELPRALDIELDNNEAARAFAVRLYESVVGLQNAYPTLLNQIGEQVRGAFNLSGSDDEVRSQLQRRLKPLQRYATDRQLKLLITTVLDPLPRGDWREAVGRAIQGGAPPTHWNDVDVRDFQVKLQHTVTDLSRLATLATERDREGVQQVVRIDILGGEEDEGEPVIIPLTEQLEREARAIATQIQDLLARTGDPSANGRLRQLRLAALAQVAAGVMADA